MVRQVRNAPPPGEFSYAASFITSLGLGLAITLVATLQGLAITLTVVLLVYGVARIGGFTAS